MDKLYWKYWIRNLKTDEELVVPAKSYKEACQKVGWDVEVVKLLKRKKISKDSKLILSY